MTSPEPTDSLESSPPQRRGLALLADVFIAPRRAFETIAATGEWWPAFAVVLACELGQIALVQPALKHFYLVLAHADPATSGLDPATLSARVNVVIAFNAIFTIFAPLLVWMWSGLILMVVARGGLAQFRTYFALAANAWLPAAAGTLAIGIAIRLHDPASFNSLAQLVLALPDSLASFAPHDSDRALSFLSYFDLFQGWSLLLVAYGLRAIGKVRLIPALITSFAIGLAFALLQTAAGF